MKCLTFNLKKCLCTRLYRHSQNYLLPYFSAHKESHSALCNTNMHRHQLVEKIFNTTWVKTVKMLIYTNGTYKCKSIFNFFQPRKFVACQKWLVKLQLFFANCAVVRVLETLSEAVAVENVMAWCDFRPRHRIQADCAQVVPFDNFFLGCIPVNKFF
jgi:hypothetical protein